MKKGERVRSGQSSRISGQAKSADSLAGRPGGVAELMGPRRPKVGYRTRYGRMIMSTAEDALRSRLVKQFRGKVQLIFTSPPFLLNRKKKYGNLQGEEYVNWLASFARPLREMLKPDGSIVMELGNSWEPGRPVMSTLALRALLAFLDAGRFLLCQQFVCFNPARLPGPAQWVNIERIRVKDAFTHIWWMSPVERPKADNRRALRPYSAAMLRLLESGRYNAGRRPSEHHIGASSFLKNNNGAIAANVLTLSNTAATDEYQRYCRAQGLPIHPARMHTGLAEFFIKFLSVPRNVVLDPFAGSNITGAAAERLKRRWLSIEPCEEYVLGSRGRFYGVTRKSHIGVRATARDGGVQSS